jgi:hypothetical protein
MKPKEGSLGPRDDSVLMSFFRAASDMSSPGSATLRVPRTRLEEGLGPLCELIW